MKNFLMFSMFSLMSVMTNQVMHAQQLDTNEMIGGMNSIYQYYKFTAGNEELKGNPFLFEEWNTKGVVYADGKYVEVDKLNYNIYKEEIGALKEKESVFVYESQYIDSVKIDNIRLHKINEKFYVALQTGSKASLFKKYETRIVEGMFNPTDGTSQKSRLVIMDDFYVLSGGNLQKFKPSKGALDDIFGGQAQEMKKIIKEKKLNYKKEEDLISIFESYNGL